MSAAPGTAEYPFTDPVANRECALVVPAAGPAGIRHPGCDRLAAVCVELDAFWCPACHWNGRVSGAWCTDMIGGSRA